jgi:hypothetical protein
MTENLISELYAQMEGDGHWGRAEDSICDAGKADILSNLARAEERHLSAIDRVTILSNEYCSRAQAEVERLTRERDEALGQTGAGR